MSRWSHAIALAAGLLAARPASAQPPGPKAPAAPANVTLPTVVEHVDAVYPPDKLAQGIDTNVEVLVTVERNGTVGDAQIAVSGGEAFDAAALAAVRRWRFSPATRDGVPIRARIRVPFHFAPEPHPPVPVPPGAPAETPPDGAAPTHADKSHPADQHHPDKHDHPAELDSGLALPHAVAEPGKPIEIHVQGRPNPPRRGASDFRIGRAVLDSAPRPTAADILKSAPGIHVMRPEGDAVAQRVYLRGFDADHGQDIQFTLAGTVPLNQPSHIHGQGYADLNVLIPETVRSVRVLEGVYDPHQGDFAVAGSVDFDLGVEERGVRATATYGSFDTKRLVAVFAPAGQSEETFGAAVVRTTDGFGDGTRGGLSGGFTGQYRFELPGDLSALVHVSAYGARSGVAGVLRRADIDNRIVDFYGAYPDTSARSQSAAATRAQASFSLQRNGDDGSEASFGLWGAHATYRSRLNFTGYTQRSRQRPTWAGRGDLIEQSNADAGFGARASYRTRRYEAASWLKAQLTLGGDAEIHSIDQAQNLLEAPQNETWDRRVDTSLSSLRAGAYADALFTVTRWARLRGGLRADLISFDIDDRLGNRIPSTREETHFVGYRRTAAGIAWGPRATLEVDPLPSLRLFAAYGQGYRSPQARQLEEGEQAPFAKVHSYEAGARFTYEPARITTTLVAYETRLSYDLAFDPEEGRLERIGPTTRRGLVAHLQASPVSGFNASLSATFVRATLDSPPPPTPENPTPPYVEGQSLPFVPPVVVRADVSYRRPLAKLLGKPLVGRAGYGATFLSPRPLPYAQEARAVFVVDASLGLRRDFVEIGVDATNLLNARYADTEYVFVSDWRTSDIPSHLPARHISAGSPLTILGNLTFHL
ncbi:TonB-dependent receptor domain-containing protein [Polyangium spumosum]|uniref:TonB family protein n=1 Tax=Polyangium spumosum TaxID=889282 RepID=A0A6N7PRN5_9BACT|nr:TonB-dependent receptor [Polyangium spumosum]MRG94589.1 TonB family protein [Polyangium spumosum]